MIEVKDLTKDYHIRKGLFKPFNIVNAVKGVSFSINQGEKIGLIGLNGAGKSTLMKMMSGVLKPTSGSVRVNGFIPYQRENSFLKSIGVVMGQKSILLYAIPVKDSLKYYKEVYGIDDKTFKERLSYYDEILNLKELYDTPVRKLSFGQRMRCELCASLLHNPKVIFLDEPTIGLDIVVKNEILSFLDYLNKNSNTTICLTTHNIDEIEKLCSRLIIVDKGQIVFDGDKRLFNNVKSDKIIRFKNENNISIDYLESISKKVIYGDEIELVVLADRVNEIVSFLVKNSVSDINISDESLEDLLIKFYGENNKWEN